MQTLPTQTPTLTLSRTPTLSQTPTLTLSRTPTLSQTPTLSLSQTPTLSQTWGLALALTPDPGPSQRIPRVLASCKSIPGEKLS